MFFWIISVNFDEIRPIFFGSISPAAEKPPKVEKTFENKNFIQSLNKMFEFQTTWFSFWQLWAPIKLKIGI